MYKSAVYVCTEDLKKGYVRIRTEDLKNMISFQQRV